MAYSSVAGWSADLQLHLAVVISGGLDFVVLEEACLALPVENLTKYIKYITKIFAKITKNINVYIYVCTYV